MDNSACRMKINEVGFNRIAAIVDGSSRQLNALEDQMSDQVKKGTVDPEKVMEMLGPSMKAGQQIMETFLKGMGSAMETASTMEEDSKKKSTSE